MQCPTCQNEARKFGKDRYGNQRFQCLECGKTFSDRPAKPLDEMRISLDKALLVLKLLTEGNSVRATSRISGVAKATVLALLVCVGEKCEWFLAERMKDLPVKNVQADEIWGFVRMNEKVRNKKEIADEEVGDAYCYVAIERDTKLILSWHLGKRDAPNTLTFIEEVERSTRGRFQLSTDGFKPYPETVAVVFENEGRDIDHAIVVKEYGKFEDDHRYSPSEVLGIDMTRLTNAFSKKWANHQASLALHFATYNFVTPHGTLTKKAGGIKATPAMEAGLTDHPWTLAELLTEAAKSTHC